MNDKQRQQLDRYLSDATIVTNVVEFTRWSNRVETFLSEAMGADVAARFVTLVSNNEFDELALKRGYLEGLIAKDEDELTPQYSVSLSRDTTGMAPTGTASRKVFLVHGHDSEVKETVARFIEKLGLDPIILHEQPNQGRTVIEKFETSSSGVAFAVVLLTPDDLGSAANASSELQSRARQNVILELGYFLGRLGRTRVCALHKGGVELPSDFQGVIYIEFDSGGAWRAKLAQEFVEAKLTIKIEGLINR